MIFLSMCFLVFYNYIVAQKGHYDFFFLHNYMDFIPELLYCSAIVALLLQNSFIALQLSRYCSRTPLLLTDCRVIAPELLYCSAIVALLRQNSFIALQLSRSCSRTPLLLSNCRVMTS